MFSNLPLTLVSMTVLLARGFALYPDAFDITSELLFLHLPSAILVQGFKLQFLHIAPLRWLVARKPISPIWQPVSSVARALSFRSSPRCLHTRARAPAPASRFVFARQNASKWRNTGKTSNYWSIKVFIYYIPSESRPLMWNEYSLDLGNDTMMSLSLDF